jgi:alpha-galactosidase
MKLKAILTLFNALSVIVLLQAQPSVEKFTMTGIPMELSYTQGHFEITVTTTREMAGLEVATIQLKSEQKFVPEEMSIKWTIPSSNIAGYWSSRCIYE